MPAKSVVLLALLASSLIAAEPARFIPVTIPADETLSSAVDLSERVLVGIAMPAAWDAADLTLQMSPDGGATWLDVLNAVGVEESVAAEAGRYFHVDAAHFRGIRYIRLRSGTSASPVEQAEARTLILVVRRLEGSN
ncbi:MAG: hypothetical protein KIT09_02165 [Bryobacteraceae bacterium]|nr:hypothetical protein [Bryobacteraceae bacterium]